MKNRLVLISTMSIALLGGVLTMPSWGLTVNEVQKLLASDGTADDEFGFQWGSAVSGDTALVGSRPNSGYVFVRNGTHGITCSTEWCEQTKLVAGGEIHIYNLGVALDGDTAMIGATVFVRNGTHGTTCGTEWCEQAILTPSDGAGPGFGKHIALDGDTAVIGDFLDDEQGHYAGAAYVFVRSGAHGTNCTAAWCQQTKLTASDGADSDKFGVAVAISSDTIVVGANSDDDKGSSSGSAYVFVRAGSTWSEESKLIASDGATIDYFGSDVALDADTTLIRAPREGKDAPGSVYVFVRSGSAWSEQGQLTASDDAARDSFGVSVALEGDIAVIGAHNDDDNGEDSGSAYVFERNSETWTEQAKLTAGDGAADDNFGISAALAGSTIIIGAPGDDENGTKSGSAYVFSLETASTVPLDFKPGNPRNVINPKKQGKCWVAVLSSDYFDALQVAPETVALGLGAASPDRYRVKDVNRDRLPDLMLRFRTPEVGFQCGDTEVELIGETYAGDSIIGSDTVKTVGCKKLKNGIKKSKKVKKK